MCNLLFFSGCRCQCRNEPNKRLYCRRIREHTTGKPKLGSDFRRAKRFWIQLTSGEWLKGDLKVLYDDKLEFDSGELDLLELDWEDVKEIRGHRRHSVRFEGPVTVVGILKVVGDKIFVTTQEKVFVFDRSDLISIAYGEKKEIGYWSAKISLGLDIREGNTNQINYSTSAYVKRRTSASRFYIDYLGIFNKTEGIETASSQRIGSNYDIFLKRNIFWRPVFAEYFKDRFSNIENRVTLGTGIGYSIINTSKTDWDISLEMPGFHRW